MARSARAARPGSLRRMVVPTPHARLLGRAGGARPHGFEVAIGDLSTEPSMGDSALSIADRDELARGFDRLDPDERAIIVLHHYLDLPLPDVAMTLGIP